MRTFKLEGLELVRLRSGMSVREALDLYRRDPDVMYAEPNHIVTATALPPNDPHFPSQWGLQKIDALAAWDITTGSADVVVAVLDTGI
jgi:thermitase